MAKALLVAALLTVAGYAAIQPSIATDAWWALAAGRWIVEHGEVQRVDVFSHTYPGAPWVNGEWLSQVLFWAIYRSAGGTALALFKVLYAAAFYLAAAWIGWRRSGSLGFAVAATAAVLGCRTFFDIKSDVFLFAGTLGLLAVLEEYRRGARPALLLVVPLMFALWVNLHFSWVFGLGVLGLLTAVESARTALGLPGALPGGRVRALVVATAGAVLACLLNPYGVHTLAHPFTILMPDSIWRKDINEWLPPVLLGEGGLTYVGWFFLVQGVLALGALLVDWRRFDWPNAALVAVTVAMALGARRFVGIFAMVAVPFAATNLATVTQALTARVPQLSSPTLRLAAVAAFTLPLTAALLIRAVPFARATYAQGFFRGTVQEDYFPVGAAEFLNRNTLPGNLFHPYTWGGYLMFWTRRPVFIDGRGHLVYPDDFYVEESTAEYGQRGWTDILDRRQVSLIVWPSMLTAGGRERAVLDMLLRAPEWRRVYDDRRSVVFAHAERGREWVAALERFALNYPDDPRVRVFLAERHFAAHHFEVARQLLREAGRELPGAGVVSGPEQERLAAAARASNAPGAWFQLAFARDVRDDPGAAEAYAEALALGLPEPYAGYAREALGRLRGG